MRRRSKPFLTVSAALACVLALAAPASPGPTATIQSSPISSLSSRNGSRSRNRSRAGSGRITSRSPTRRAKRRCSSTSRNGQAPRRSTRSSRTNQFFRDQIEASKDVQNALFANWRALRAAPEESPPDLAKDTRPKLDRLTQSLMSALAHVEPMRHADDCPIRLAESLARWKHLTRYDSSMNAPITRALSHVCASGSVGAVG